MEDDGDAEIDVAAQMGFASFGSKPKHKKRKLDDASGSSQAQAPALTTGSSHLEPRPLTQPTTAEPAQPDLKAYRYGVKNERGDTAYFMPSFIEDPWKDLRKKET